MPSQHPIAPDDRYDRLMAAFAAWFIVGLFADGYSHYHDVRESFFTPYHAVLYAGFFVNALGVGIPIVRNVRRGLGWRQAVPPGYDLTAIGVAMFAFGVFPDLTWHRVFGIEEGIDVLISPTHLFMGIGLALIVLGPARSAFLRTDAPRTLSQQLPMAVSLGLFLAMVEFTLQFAFDAGIATGDAPMLANRPGGPDLSFFLLPFTYYKQALGITIVLIHVTLLAGVALYAVRSIRLAYGVFSIAFALPALFMASLLANGALSVYVPVVEALVAGLVADTLVLRLDPNPARPVPFRWFAIAVPVSVQAVYLAFSAALLGGIWWDVNLTFGSLLFAGVAGALLSFLMSPPPTEQARA